MSKPMGQQSAPEIHKDMFSGNPLNFMAVFDKEVDRKIKNSHTKLTD